MNWLDELDSRRWDIREEDVTRLIATWRAAQVVAAQDWRSSVSEREHYARIDKMDALREALKEPDTKESAA